MRLVAHFGDDKITFFVKNVDETMPFHMTLNANPIDLNNVTYGIADNVAKFKGKLFKMGFCYYYVHGRTLKVNAGK